MATSIGQLKCLDVEDYAKAHHIVLTKICQTDPRYIDRRVKRLRNILDELSEIPSVNLNKENYNL